MNSSPKAVGRTTIYLGPCFAPVLRLAVFARRRPCPEYLLFARRNRVALVGFDPFRRGFNKNRLEDTASLERKLGKYTADPKRVNAIIAATDHLGYMVARYAVSLSCEVPLYVIAHGFLLNDQPRMRFLASCPNVRFLCLSQAIQQRIITAFEIPERRVVNAGYGVDIHFFEPIPSANVSRYVVSAGAAHRDYRTLVAAVRGLNIQVRIAADSDWNSYPIDVQNADLPSNVLLGSSGNYRDLRTLYAHASAVIVPLYDVPRACGYAVISEAMAMGKILVATRTQCPSDFILEGETGHYVEPGDVAGLRRRIEEILEDPDAADKMGACARARMTTNFSLEEYCRRLEAAIVH